MIAGILLMNEWLKAVKRFAFWVTVLSFLTIEGVGFGSQYYRSTHPPFAPVRFAFPQAWSDILGGPVGGIPGFFGAVLLILLVTSEFEWRTARQNVIDGLSKDEWFAAKGALVPFTMLLFVGLHLVLGVGFAFAATDMSKLTGPLVPHSAWMALGGAVLNALGYAALALFVGLAVRASGSAMALWLLYVAILETLIAASLVQMSDAMRPVVKWFPAAVFGDVRTPASHTPEAIAAAIQRAQRFGFPEPIIWTYEKTVLVASAWIVALLAGAYFMFRRRDL